MIISNIEFRDKTLFHEIPKDKNFNTLQVVSYETNKWGSAQKINNGATHIIDICKLNENQIMVAYVPAILNKIVCKILTIEGTYININSPVYTIAENTNTSKISIAKISSSICAIFFNDNENNNGKVVLCSINNTKIKILKVSLFFDKGVIPELRAIKTIENEIIVFFQFGKNGMVRLFTYENDDLFLKEEALFFTGSNLWDLKISKIRDCFIVSFINSDFKLNLKVLSIDKTIKFTHGLGYLTSIDKNGYKILNVDNSMILYYFNNTVQIINLNNGRIIQPENIK